MKFPSWAPQALVNVYADDLESLNYSRSEERQEFWKWAEANIPEEEKAPRPHDSLKCSHGLEYQQTQQQERLDKLKRLLTQPDMEGAWASMKNAQSILPPHYLDQLPWLLWWQLSDRLKKFNSTDHQTAREKSQTLSRLAKMARDLAHEIQSNQVARQVAFHSVRTELHRQSIEYMERNNEAISSAERILPMGLSEDFESVLRNVGMASTKPFKKQSLNFRVSFWLKEAIGMGLVTLLERFAEAMEQEAKEPPLLKQPGRKGSALKAYLVRETHELMMWMYGQPLDDTVARIVTALLDLDSPLTRDDIRPYLKKGGKKSTEF